MTDSAMGGRAATAFDRPRLARVADGAAPGNHDCGRRRAAVAGDDRGAGYVVGRRRHEPAAGWLGRISEAPVHSISARPVPRFAARTVGHLWFPWRRFGAAGVVLGL